MKRDEEDEETKPDAEPESGTWIYHVPILLRKYGSHMLLALSLVLLGFILWQRYRQNQIAKEDESWVKLAEAQNKVAMAESGLSDENPASILRDVASKAELPAVRAQAYLLLGQYYLNAINRGHYGLAEKLDVAEALTGAEAAYKKILSESTGITPFTLSARMGLARVAEDQNDWAAAAEQYKKVVTEAQQFGNPILEKTAADHLSNLPRLQEPIAMAPSAPPASMPSFFPGAGPGVAPR